jgi:dolichol-phosphate mannosyltransferase
MRGLVIIPTYNERENIEALAKDILSLDLGLDILVIDDNSPDGTAEAVLALREEHPEVRLLKRPGKQGLGTAYVAGFKYALAKGYDFVFEMDADFSHQPKYLPHFIEALGEHDLVLGSRYVDGGGVENWSLTRQLISKFGSWYGRTILAIDIRDLTGGFKCYKREVLEAIDPDSIQSNGYSFQIETTYKAHNKGFAIKEIPITFVERRAGASKMSKAIVLEAIVMVWKLRLSNKS